MKDPRAELLRQMAALRQQVDPVVLDRARNAAARTTNTVPYDRERALAAVKFFLANRQDGGKFRQKLLTALKGETGSPGERVPEGTAAPAPRAPAPKAAPTPSAAKPPGGALGWLRRRF